MDVHSGSPPNFDNIHNIKYAPLVERERMRLRACRFQREGADYAQRARIHMGIE